MVSFNCRISPETFTVIFFERSPPAMAVATSAMLRTCAVRLPAMKLTLSVKSFHVPATPGTCAWPPSLPSVPTSRATRAPSQATPGGWRPPPELARGAGLARDAGHFRGERVELVHHGVDGVLELENFAPHIDGDLA